MTKLELSSKNWYLCTSCELDNFSTLTGFSDELVGDSNDYDFLKYHQKLKTTIKSLGKLRIQENILTYYTLYLSESFSKIITDAKTSDPLKV